MAQALPHGWVDLQGKPRDPHWADRNRGLPLVRIEGISRRVRDPLSRLMAQINYTAWGCWEWSGQRYPTGYGKFRVGRPPVETYAHRWSYLLFCGPIPADQQIDHLCKNASCINPDHLQAVTGKVNTARGNAGRAASDRQRSKTHCRNGHDYAGGNLYVYPNGWRGCRECNRQAQKTYSMRKKARS